MNILVKVLVLLSLVTGGYGKRCSKTFEVKQDAVVVSPGFPSDRPHHSCKRYRYTYTSPSETTLSLECSDFMIQCKGRDNYFAVTDSAKKCGKSFPKVMTSGNSLKMEYKAKSNAGRIPGRRSVFKFKCHIQVHYPVHDSESCDCPVQDFAVSTRIISGTDVKEGEIPYQVAIIENKEFMCGGSLISEKWVVTSGAYKIHTSCQVRMGFVNIKEVSRNEVTRNITSVTKHPNYNNLTYQFDIALVELDEPVTFTPYIRPICLPDDLIWESLAFEVGTATGWGVNELSEYSTILQKVSLNIITNYEAALYYKDSIFDETLCTYTDRKDTCKGDAGGPLAYTRYNRVYLIGSISFGVGCALPGLPSCYTRVNSLRVLTWIRETIGVYCHDKLVTSAPVVQTYSCDVCGKRKLGWSQTRIVGGDDAQEGEFPYQASIVDIYGTHFCGGSLISNEWVVTAAHCKIIKYEHKIILGEYDTHIVSNNEKGFYIEQVVTHPDYDKEKSKCDISLIQLQEQVTFTDYIQPICLPDGFGLETFESKKADASGWGALEDEGLSPNLLQKVTLDVISNVRCKILNGIDIYRSSLCTLTQGKDTCQGDSGGPLAYHHNGRSYLIGVTSWGFRCAYLNFPGVYVRVTHPVILSWIKRTTGINCKAP